MTDDERRIVEWLRRMRKPCMPLAHALTNTKARRWKNVQTQSNAAIIASDPHLI